MKIKKVTVDGFRCLQELEISFEDELTVIVGENDAGKSSLVDCLKVITQNKSVEFDDFNYDTDTIKLSIEIENFVFYKNFFKHFPYMFRTRRNLVFRHQCRMCRIYHCPIQMFY